MQPYAGPSGRMLNMSIANLGLARADFVVMHVVNCRPPDETLSSEEGQVILKCCTKRFKEELAEVKASGVKVLVPMGQEACDALGVEGSVEKVRGSVYRINGSFVVPTVSPQSFLGNSSKRKGQGINMIAAFGNDLQKAHEVATQGWKPYKEKFNIKPSLKDVSDFVDTCLYYKHMVAVDIETTGLDARRGGRIVMIGLAYDKENALVVPLLDQGDKPYWSEAELPKVKALLEKLFAQGRLIFQNCFFDIPFMQQCGWAVDVSQVAHDTMVVHSLVAPEEPHNLGYIVSIFGKTPEWKEIFKNKAGKILDQDQSWVRTYNARDCVVLHQVLEGMLKQLRDLDLWNFYMEETHPLMKPFMKMTQNGVGFDFAHMKDFSKRINQLVEDKVKEIRDAYHLGQAFNFDSDDDLRWLLFGKRPDKFAKLDGCLLTYEKVSVKGEVKLATKLLRGYATTDVPLELLPETRVVNKEVVKVVDHVKAGTAAHAELVALQQLADLKPLYVPPGLRSLKTDTGKIGVGAEALLSYRIQLQNRLAVVGELKTPRPEEEEAIFDVLRLIELLGEQAELSKLRSSFANYLPHADNRIRPSWAMHGTATGRLSCRAPALTTLPSRGEGADVRRFFVAADGWSIVDADFTSAEVALLGYETQDPVIIDIYEQGRNIHEENARILFGLAPEEEVLKEQKAAAKVFQFGGLSYGGGNREIYKKILLKNPKLPMTFAQFEQAKQNWMDAHPAYVSWRDKIVAEVISKRILYNAFGRARIFMGSERDIIKEGMNFMIQSLGACLINRVMLRLDKRFEELGMRTKMVMQVYDELVLEAPDDEVEQAKAMLLEEMQRPFSIHGRMAVIRAEAGVGKTYGDAK